ncbi:hypothetical protein [Microbacterium gilvum]|uniref:Uncharacterized protein n=1 Tax=Microbacterium gilvum TaxID=1336204 RepID=A0ABP9AR88_9MICO
MTESEAGGPPLEDVPAGRGGADSGSAEVVGVEGEAPGSPDEGEQNDVAGVGPAEPSPGRQTEPREDVHTTTDDERLRGIVAQVQGDIAIGNLSPDDAVGMVAARLRDAGIAADGDDLERIARETVERDAPTLVDDAEPGAGA